MPFKKKPKGSPKKKSPLNTKKYSIALDLEKCMAGSDYVPPKNIREVFRKAVNWEEMAKVVLREAVGGYSYMNGNGVTAIARPNLDWAKLMYNYSFGMPQQEVATDEELKRTLNDFSNFVRETNTGATNVVNEATKLINQPEEVLESVAN